MTQETRDSRAKLLTLIWLVCACSIILRLFYWQILNGQRLQAAAKSQYSRTEIAVGQRGRIFLADNHLLVGNQTVYRLTADPSVLTNDSQATMEQIWPYIEADYEEIATATEPAKIKELTTLVQTEIVTKLNQKDKKWVALKNKISANSYEKLKALDLPWMGFEPLSIRFYPEASMAAQVVGFVGKNEAGQDQGYFGIEGALNNELAPKSSANVSWTDALGHKLLWLNSSQKEEQNDGRDVVLTIRRDMQAMVEKNLKEAMEKYQAKSGEVIVMDPTSGAILAMASYPNYNPAKFYQFESSLYKNPVLTNLYEPGSTFKTLTVAAGLNEKVIEPDTQCDMCEGPVNIGEFSIKTWNNEYHPNITITDALAKSDNTAMVFVAQKLGKDKFKQYLNQFGIGSPLYIDLQEDQPTPTRDKWGDIHLATHSFGQGIVANTMQMIRAVGAIANQGKMMRPYIVAKVIEENGKEIVTSPVVERQVVDETAAQETARMMVFAAQSGEAQWTRSKNHIVAGKTGTSQVAVDGKYDNEKTIASFIGFSPLENPKFIMIVKLEEPQSSIWAAETAAPLWYKIADQLFLLLNIPPDRIEQEPGIL